MSTQRASGSNSSSGGAVASQSRPSLPDLNSGSYPFETVQQLVDRAAWINMYAIPEANRSVAAVRAPQGSSGAASFECTATLHRFGIETTLPAQGSCLKANNTVGQPAGRLDLRWAVIPFNFAAAPGASLPTMALDPSRSQRFVIQEATFSFGDGRDGFRSFGTGRTFPKEVGGRSQLVAAAIGNITEGFGRFAGLEGNYIVAGQVTEGGGIVGDIMARMVDPGGILRARGPIPPIVRTADSEQGVTYLTLSSRKSGPNMLTTYNLGPDGQPRGLNVPQQLLHARTDFTPRAEAGFGAEVEQGPVIGQVISLIHTAAGGTGAADSPLSFQGAGRYSFTDRQGQFVGGYTGQSLEGRNFAMQLAGAPGQQAFRYGYFGPILHGRGCFGGVEGMFFGCAGVGISPHVLSNLFIVRLHDPEGRFRAAPGELRP